MFARFKQARKRFARFFALASLLWLAACDVTLDPNANTGRLLRRLCDFVSLLTNFVR